MQHNVRSCSVCPGYMCLQLRVHQSNALSVYVSEVKFYIMHFSSIVCARPLNIITSHLINQAQGRTTSLLIKLNEIEVRWRAERHDSWESSGVSGAEDRGWGTWVHVPPGHSVLLSYETMSDWQFKQNWQLTALLTRWHKSESIKNRTFSTLSSLSVPGSFS